MLGYSLEVSLRACPFCRELFGPDETAGKCPECGVDLVGLNALPLSLEAQAEEALAGSSLAEEDRRLGFWDLGRGKGPLLALAVVGLAAFFLPWIELRSPYLASLSGFDLARRAGWFWAGAVAWFVSIPLVFTRRTLRQMRGVRAVLTVFALLSVIEVVVLVAVPRHENPVVRVDYSWGYGLMVTALASLAGAAWATRFGGAAPRRRHSIPPPSLPSRPPEGVSLH